jgi:hypothetical protein
MQYAKCTNIKKDRKKSDREQAARLRGLINYDE